MVRIINNKDFLSGVLFSVVGASACLVAWGYPIGTAATMGPGYFPIIVGGALVAFGAILMLTNLRVTGEPLDGSSLRAVLLVIGSILVFGLIFKPLGLVVSSLALVVISAAATPESRPREVFILYIGLIASLVAIFVYALSLPINLWPSF